MTLDLVLAITLAASVGTVALLAWRLWTALDARNDATRALVDVAKQRDDWKVLADEKTAEVAEVRTRLGQVEDQRNRTFGDTLMHVRNELDKADMPAAVKIVTDLFAEPLPGATR
jgi:hypothetical protein